MRTEGYSNGKMMFIFPSNIDAAMNGDRCEDVQEFVDIPKRSFWELLIDFLKKYFCG